jgi:hypothetical protein
LVEARVEDSAMSDKPHACTADGCTKSFASKRARHQHVCAVHQRKKPAARPMARMSRGDVYDFVDALDLPDGAHWAMIEELSGLEPADFAA